MRRFTSIAAAILLASLASAPQLAAQVPIKFVVGGNPAGGVTFRVIHLADRTSEMLTTTADGSADANVDRGQTYRIESMSPYIRDGSTYRWNYRVTVDDDAITLTEEHAVVTSAPRTVRFGLSVGARIKLGREEDRLRRAVIQYPDTVVRIDNTDRSDLILSGVATVFPFEGGAHWLGFTANINLADLGSGSLSLNNKSVEGGIGFAIKASDDFAIGLTWERVFSRRLHGYIQDGDPIISESGQRVTTLDPADGRYFVEDNQHGIGLHFIFRF